MLGKVTFKSNALQYEDAGESACVLAGEGEQIPGRFGGRDVARRVAGRPRAGALGSIA